MTICELAGGCGQLGTLMTVEQMVCAVQLTSFENLCTLASFAAANQNKITYNAALLKPVCCCACTSILLMSTLSTCASCCQHHTALPL
jgi:hypothetical protein